MDLTTSCYHSFNRSLNGCFDTCNDDKENQTPPVNNKRKLSELDLTEKQLFPTTPKKIKSQRIRGNQVRRQIFDVNCGPSISQSEKDKAKREFSEQSIKEHAFMRIQLFSVTAAIIYGIATRSKKDHFRDISIEIGPAYLQVGRGSHTYHAAHSNLASGLVDNVRSVVINQISDEKTISPKTLKLLSCKGFSEDEIEEITRNCSNIEKIKEIFDKAWPFDKRKPHSIIVGTPIDFTLNSTTEAPQSLNLICDKNLEIYFRPKIVHLYHRLMRAEITQEDACKHYVKEIIKYFEELEPEIQERLTRIDEYIQELTKLENNNSPKDEMIELLTSIHKKCRELGQESDSSKNSDFNLPQITLTKNKKFLNDSLYNLNNKKKYFEAFINKMNKILKDLKTEVTNYQKNLIDYLKFCQLEKVGTQLPDFTSLFGEIDDVTGLRTLSEHSLHKAQERMLKPFSPQITPTSSPIKTHKLIRI